MVSDSVRKAIEIALGEMGISGVNFSLERPADLSHGDYATNVAMVCAKSLGKNPREVAEMIISNITAQNIPEIASVDIAGPGFINFKLAPEFFVHLVSDVLAKADEFGKSTIHAGKKILVEHSSPNLFKPFHIGHMMNNAIGESLVRLMQASGAIVRTMSFPSDISLGIAKAIFILLEDYDENFVPSDISVLGNAYVSGTKRYDEDESIHARVKEIADNLYAGIPSPECVLYERCKQLNIEYFEHVVARLGTHFDSYIYESEAGVIGKELVGKYTPAVFTESEGAVVYIPEEAKKHLNTSVFVNSQGNPTYDAKDLGLLKMKFDREAPDVSIFVTDYQQIPHFQIVMDAAEKIQPEWVAKSVHIPHGRMSFKGQKMSSRLGGVPLATDMLDLVAEEVRERSTHKEVADILDAVSIGAIKFAILRAKPGQNINFDPDTSLSFEGDSGPYLQYTHARIQSLIEKGQALGLERKYVSGNPSDVERTILHFPEIVERAISEYAPQYIVTYLLNLAQEFNSFYSANKIIDESDVNTSSHRLAIAHATQIVIKNGLRLLGITAPERM